MKKFTFIAILLFGVAQTASAQNAKLINFTPLDFGTISATGGGGIVPAWFSLTVNPNTDGTTNTAAGGVTGSVIKFGGIRGSVNVTTTDGSPTGIYVSPMFNTVPAASLASCGAAGATISLDTILVTPSYQNITESNPTATFYYGATLRWEGVVVNNDCFMAANFEGAQISENFPSQGTCIEQGFCINTNYSAPGSCTGGVIIPFCYSINFASAALEDVHGIAHKSGYRLNFGSICAPKAGEGASAVTIPPEGAAYPSAGVSCFDGAGAQADQFEVQGDSGGNISSVSFPRETVGLSSGSNTISVSGFTSNCDLGCTLDNLGNFTLKVGATVHIPPGTPDGEYVGHYEVIITH